MIRQPELHRSLADTSGVRRYQRFGGILKWSGTSVLPRVFAAPAAMQMALRVS